MAKDENNPICWSRGRGTAAAIRKTATTPTPDPNTPKSWTADARAKDAKRLARYFQLLAIREKPEKGEDGAYIIRTREGLDRRLPRLFEDAGRLRPPLPAGQGLFPGNQRELRSSKRPTRLTYLNEARKLLRQVELSENDFTDQARRLKIQVIYKQQGGFNEPVAKLKDFEDCYVRAQFEQMELLKDEKDHQEPRRSGKEEKGPCGVITAALEKGLKLAKPGRGRRWKWATPRRCWLSST